MKADVILAEQANNAVVVLKALALTYPPGHPDATILDAAANIASVRVLHLLGKEPEAPELRLGDSEGGA